TCSPTWLWFITTTLVMAYWEPEIGVDSYITKSRSWMNKKQAIFSLRMPFLVSKNRFLEI
ncbi:MAG: hypothetical protein MJE63_09725, partial [Proteobacteria bacterium]|nr:hypothetical protein [Pseudomonadota bacterium]